MKKKAAAAGLAGSDEELTEEELRIQEEVCPVLGFGN